MFNHRFTSVTAAVSTLLLTLAILTTWARAENYDVGIDTEVTQTTELRVPANLDKIAADHLFTVFTIGKEIGHPETLQAILMQETNGGRSSRIGNPSAPLTQRSYGLMQVQIVAARSVFNHFPQIRQMYFEDRSTKSLSNQEIASLLLDNDDANIRIAAYHFKIYMNLAKGNWTKAVAAYNMGIGNAFKITDHNTSYVQSIRNHLKTFVQPFNRKNDLTLTQTRETR